jgi:hypothetical protein
MTPPPPTLPAAQVQILPEIAPVGARSTSVPADIAPGYLAKVGRADDFRWITGQLYYIHVHGDQGFWVVRYAPIDKEDRYGGSVVLAPVTSMQSFREGDLVTVHGDLLNEGRATRFVGGPLYRAAAVNLDQRAQP